MRILLRPLLKEKHATDEFDPGAQGLDNQKCVLATAASSAFIFNEADSFGFVLKDDAVRCHTMLDAAL